jgi:hypothetical protein
MAVDPPRVLEIAAGDVMGAPGQRWDMVHEVLELVGLLIVAGAGPVDLVHLVDDDKAGSQVRHQLACLLGERRLGGADGVRGAEEIQEFGGRALGCWAVRMVMYTTGTASVICGFRAR